MGNKNVFEVANSVSHRKCLQIYAGQVARYRQLFNCVCKDHSDSTPSLKCFDETNTSYCFGCRKSFTNVDLVVECLGISPLEAAIQICNDFNLEYDKPKPKEPENTVWSEDFKKYTAVLSYVYQLSLDIYKKSKLKWAAKRGLPDADIGYLALGNQSDGTPLLLSTKIKQMLSKSFKIEDEDLVRYGLIYKSTTIPEVEQEALSQHYTPFYQRYILPLRDKDGHIVGLIGRRNPTEDKEYETLKATDSDKAKIYNDKHPKYYNSVCVSSLDNPDGSKNPPLFKKGDHLFNFSTVRFSKEIYVVEGPMDALSLAALGHPNVVALSGCAMTQAQYDLLKNKDIILCLDNDKAGQKAIYDILMAHKDKPFKVLKLDGVKDFNEALVNNVALPKAQRAPLWLVGYVTSVSDWTNDDGRCAAWKMFAQYCGADRSSYTKMYPINTSYLPPTLFEAWKRFNRVYRKH